MAVISRSHFNGLESLRVGRFQKKINTSCIVYRLGDLVVDAGPPNQWKYVQRFLKERAISRLLITHHHEDHCGNGAKIGKHFNCPVHAHPAGHKDLEQGFAVQWYRRMVWGKPERFKAEDFQPQNMTSQSGDFSLQPLHSPGHSPDMTCFIEPQRGWLFSGDVYVASRPRFLTEDENPSQEIESLRNLLKQDFQTLFCSHKGMVENGPAAIKSKLEYLLELQGEARRLYQTGLASREISRQLLGKEEFLSLLSRGHFNKVNMIRALVHDCPVSQLHHR